MSVWRARALAAIVCAAPLLPAAEGPPLRREFTVARDGEVTVTIAAACGRCDWGAPGREAAALRVEVDGEYSQHVLVTRGAEEARYSILLGPLAAGRHTLTIARDAERSAKEAGEVRIGAVDVRVVETGTPEHRWLAEAPVLHARPGTVERFSDVPLAAYVEALPENSGYRYTIVFSHEDGGTPTDRLMATWGRSTDIEFVYESERTPDGTVRQVYQGPKHEILPFRGTRLGRHPVLWVATDNNMVSDSGPAGGVRFAAAPQLIDLADVSREAFMDANPWLYAVMTAELVREGRIDSAAAAGSGNVPHPREFAYVEACGELRDATLAFDIAVVAGSEKRWYATDRGDARFRIARSGCFRSAVPLPAGTTPSQIRGLRARAYTRSARQGEAPLPPGSGHAALRRVNTIFMLAETFEPVPATAAWAGTLHVRADGPAVDVPLR